MRFIFSQKSLTRLHLVLAIFTGLEYVVILMIGISMGLLAATENPQILDVGYEVGYSSMVAWVIIFIILQIFQAVLERKVEQ